MTINTDDLTIKQARECRRLRLRRYRTERRAS
jgi:hypothetical protein